MKFKKKNKAPLSHSNLTEHENLRSHYDPNGSWTGTPDGWDKDINAPDAKGGNSHETEADRDVYGKYMPTENGYMQSEGVRTELEDGLTSGGVEAGQDIAEYPLEGQVAPSGGDSYEQNTRDMQDHKYPDHMAGNGMAETEAGGDFYTPRIQGENGAYEKKAMDKLTPAHDAVYDDQAPMDIEAGSDFYHEKLNTEVGKELYHYDIETANEMNAENNVEAANQMNAENNVEGGEDIYQNDIEFDPAKYESGEWKKRPEERPAPKRDIEIGTELSPDSKTEVGVNAPNDDIECASELQTGKKVANGVEKGKHSDIESGSHKDHSDIESGADIADGEIGMGSSVYPLGTVGMPVGEHGYPTVPDGELTMDEATIKEDITPVQDADDL